jgi:signal transduction histidine kinase/serine phosphatase RsbU (regulator of sigma subunit)
MMHFVISTIFILLGLVATPGLAADPVPPISVLDPTELLGQKVLYLEDPTGQETYESIQAKTPEAWRTSTQKTPTFGFTKSRFWLKMQIQNPTSEAALRYLEAEYSHYDEISFYVRSGADTQIFQMGDLKNFSERLIPFRNFIVPVTVPAQSDIEVLISCRTSGPLFFPIQLWTPEGMMVARAQADHFAGYYYGLLIAMLSYNFFLLITTGRRFYLYYCLYIGGFVMFQASLHGFTFPLLWPNSPGWANLCVAFFLGLSLLWMCVFTRDFLETKTQIPRADRVIQLLMVISLAVMLLAVFVGYAVAVRLGTVAALVSGLYLLGCSIYLLKRSYKPAYFYMLAFSMFLFGIVVNALKQLGVLPQTFFSEYAIQIGSALEVILLSMALGHKIRHEQVTAGRKIESLNESLEESLNEVQKLNAELIEKEKARTAFFHNTSHELRTPINGILGFVQLIIQNRFGEVSQEVGQQLRKVHGIGLSLLHQVNTILELAKSKKGQQDINWQYIDLDAVSSEVRYLMEGLSFKYPATSWSLDNSWSQSQDKAPSYIADRDKLLAIMRNLVGNAFKFERPGAGNTVEVSLDFSDGQNLVLTVRDRGIGLSAEQIPRIFEEFYQVQSDARRQYEGTGLGMAIVKKFVEQWGGSIHVESEPGQGSLFRVTLPSGAAGSVSAQRAPELAFSAASQNGLAAAAPQATTEPALERKENILVIDDNHTNCEVFQHILEQDGYKVTTCLRGSSALELLNKGYRPDIILLDLMMPEMSGEEVLRFLRLDMKKASIPVILITARASDDDKIFGLNLGADDYLAKPIVAEELLLRVRNMIQRTRLTQAALERELIEASLAQLQEMSIKNELNSHDVRDISIIHHYQSAELTGGDWFGVFQNAKNDRMYILLGDVTGHGTTSALATLVISGAVRGIIETLGQDGDRYSQDGELCFVAETLNKLMLRISSSLQKSMTLALVSLNRVTGQASYLNAGHNPIYLVHADHSTQAILAPGTPLGMSAEPAFGTKQFRLEENEFLFLFTDGLIENQGPNGEYFAARELKKILSRTEKPGEVKDVILDRVKILWQNSAPEDDVAFLIVSREPPQLALPTDTKDELGAAS